MADSMFAKYTRERLGDEIIETDKGFVTYRYLNDGKSIYIVDLYVLPEFRKEKEASRLGDIVASIGKDHGAVELIGTVNPNAKNATDSLRVLIGYGMTLMNSTNDLILFRKEL